MGNLFQELKRRKVFRVAAVYAIVAWLLIEVTSTILPTLMPRHGSIRLLLFYLYLDFPLRLFCPGPMKLRPVA